MPLRTSWGMTGAAALLAVAAFLPTTSRSQSAPSPADARKNAALFDGQVWPVLKANCVPCHSGPEPSGKLDITSRAALLKGGVSGPALVPGNAKTSLLTRAVHYDGRQMPPQGKLSADKIALLDRWIALGAPWGAATKSAGGGAAVPVKHGPPPVNAENMRFWSFQKVRRPAVPRVRNTAWVRTPIDSFILAKLEAKGMKPAAPASRATLIRRIYYDVTGLPPTPAEVQAFVADKRPDAYERVVDRLLASPQYGERWGRHWLDLVRYAETNSFERDGDKPFVWRYRDYVIRSFNADKPYDRFVREQIAGDELPNGGMDALIATGYYRLGTWDDEPADRDQAVYDDLDDIVSTTGQTFLGLTVGCARCHDHKIDPFPQKDYYKFLAFFRNVNRYGKRGGDSVAEASLRPISPKAEQERYARETADYNAHLDSLDKKIDAIEDIVRPELGGGEVDDFKNEQNRAPIIKKRVPKLLTEERYTEYEQLLSERKQLRDTPPKGLEQALCVTEEGAKAPDTFVLGRGSAHAPGAIIQPGFPSVLAPPAPKIVPPADGKSTGRRAALAAWLTSPQNPLTARVMANRVWQFHFGRGIVRTTSNFGFLGSAPTHPELLDYLSSELVRGGWRLKSLHRQILLSNAYRMSSRPDPKALAKDPENDLFQHFDMRRLDAEEIRDSVIAVSGGLNLKMYGPSILVTLPREVLAGQSVPGAGWGESSSEEQERRSVYIKVKRSLAVPILARFDSPETDATCPVRFATTQPTQALGMMNSAFLNERAKKFAVEVEKRAGTDPTARVRFALWRIYQRPPTAAEVKRGVDLMHDLRAKYGRSEDAALSDFCLVALNLNEFVYLD